MYEPDRGYKWKLATRLDNSFEFLIRRPEESLQHYSSDRSCFLHWLAGLVDSDGNIRVSPSGTYARAFLAIYSTHRKFLEDLRKAVEGFGYHFDGPYRGAEKGFITRRGIVYRDDFWNIALQRTSEVQCLLKELDLRHAEKIERKQLALALRPGTKWREVESSVLGLRDAILKEVTEFVRSAEAMYHARQHKRRRGLSVGPEKEVEGKVTS